MKNSCLALTILFFFTPVNKNFSQVSNDFLVKKVTLKGLPIEADFSSMQQDDDGFLWLGGLSGLYRYDGMHVTRFLRDPSDTNSLTHNYARTLAKDHSIS